MTTKPCYDYHKYSINFFSNNPNENALFRAIVDNSLERVKKQIDLGVYIDCRANLDRDWTPLLTSFFLGRRDIFRFLLEAGADRNAILNDNRCLADLKTNNNHEFLQL